MQSKKQVIAARLGCVRRPLDGRLMSKHLVKRSLAISGHKTSLALEPEFWAALEDEARAAHIPLARLIADIDAARARSLPERSLASAVRVWLLSRALGRAP